MGICKDVQCAKVGISKREKAGGGGKGDLIKGQLQEKCQEGRGRGPVKVA